MPDLLLHISLRSDCVFGSGSGMNSQTDIEVQQDRYGCPFLSGKTLKGLLAEECGNILCSLEKQGILDDWGDVAHKMFGFPGAGYNQENSVRFGNAELPHFLKEAIRNEVDNQRIAPAEILSALTSIRYQTAVAFDSGVAKEKSLRSKRVIIRGTPFEAQLTVLDDEKTLQLLSACVKALRRVGLGRNRGTGEVRLTLKDAQGLDVIKKHFPAFIASVSRKEG